MTICSLAVLQLAALLFNWSDKPSWVHSSSVRTAEVRMPDGKVESIRMPFGWSRLNIEKCDAPGLKFSDSAPVLPPEPARECETARAGRTSDDNEPLAAMTDAAGWRVECSDAEASVETSRDKVIFGDGSVRLWYRAKGDSPSVRMVPPGGGIAVAQPFSAVSLWVYGYRYSYSPRLDPDYVIPVMTAEFEDSDGKPFSLRIDHPRGWGGYWFKHWHNLAGPEREKALRGGCVFRGISVSGFKNRDYSIAVDMTSFCAFREGLGRPDVRPRPKRPYSLFPDQPQGMNTGAGRLEFPTTPDTVVPPGVAENPDLEFRFPAKPEESWDDLAFRWKGGEWTALAHGGGVVPRSAARGGVFKFRRVGNSVVLDMKCAPGGEAEKVSFGVPALGPDARKWYVPYLYSCVPEPGAKRNTRPGVMAFKRGADTLFASATFDWYLTGASAPYGSKDAPFGGVTYAKRTDGRRNPCYERVVWSVSPTFSEVLPNVANPPSLYRREAGSRAFAFSTPRGKTRATLLEEWRATRRSGMNRVYVNDHEDMWRDYMESFTFKTNAAPLKGGDAAQLAFGRQMRETLGYRYGPYNNFSDYPPTNENWNPDFVALEPDGQPRTSWVRSYLPKPAWAATMCERLCGAIAAKFPFDNCYSDVSTAYSPWDRQDYDARIPGAGTLSASFYAYGEILRMQQGIWKGPVHSEGWNHPYYAGLTTGDFARDDYYFGGRDFPGSDAPPWIVDYDLLRIHPLGCGVAMGSMRLFYGDGRFRPKDADAAVDRYLAAILAFGHGPRLDGVGAERMRGYFMVLPMSTAYCVAKVASIGYGDGSGRTVPTSEAVASGAVRRSQVLVEYDNGTRIAANGSMELPFRLDWNGETLELPPGGYVGAAGDGSKVFSGTVGGRRADLAVCKDFVYFDGRGKFASFAEGGSDGPAARLFGESSMFPVEGAEEVVLYSGAKCAEVPYEASKVVALDVDGREMPSAGKWKAQGGRTRLERANGVYSYRVWR